MRHLQRVSPRKVLASVVGGLLTTADGSNLLRRMLRKKSPRLAAAFVVTLSAASGCGGQTPPPENLDKPPTTSSGPENPDWVPNLGSVKGGFVRGGDGQCYIEHPANPPWMEPADCETQQPLKKPEPPKPEPTADVKPVEPKPPETPAKVDDSNLPPAPAGWKVRQDSSGGCRAYAPTGRCPRGASCNPPPPKAVKCPGNMPQDATDPAEL